MLNRLRYGAARDSESAQLADLEAYFDLYFNACCKLAVYGSLAPGQPNHQIVASIQGIWEGELVAHGEFLQQGWGAELGYPALRLSATGVEAPVQLLVSEQLPQHWPWLDKFEGPDYQRALAPIYRAGSLVTVANLYELRR